MRSLELRSAHARGENWKDAVELCVQRLEAPVDANLGFVYFSDYFAEDADYLLQELRGATGIEHWAGTVAYGVCSRREAIRDDPSISVLVGRFPEDSFHVFSGRSPLRSATSHHFAVVHADPKTPDMPELVADMAGKVDSGFVTGGLTSSRGPSLQIADEVISGGISGVAFSPSIAVATGLTQGCSPLPGLYEITACEDNVIQRLDGERALSVYLRTVGADSTRDLRNVAASVLIGLANAGSNAEDYVVRHVVGVDPHNGLLAVNEQVECGQRVLFCRRDRLAAERDMRRMLNRLRDSLAAPPQGGIYVCCTGRGSSLFDRDDSEIDLIRETFSDIPLAGFFAAGEIANDRLYGYTGVLTLFA